MLPRSLSQMTEIEEAYTEVGEELLGSHPESSRQYPYLS